MSRSATLQARSLLALLLAVETIGGCGGQPTLSANPTSRPPAPSPVSSAPPAVAIPELTSVTIDASSAARAVIGPDGGAITATDAAGNAYALAIPPGAILAPLEVVLLPISTVAGLPPEITVAAGVHLLPEGLALWAPAVLTMRVADRPTDPALPFAYRGDLEEPFEYPAERAEGTTSFGILHFSGYAQLIATPQAQAAAYDLDLPFPGQPTALGDALFGSLAPVVNGSTATVGQMTVNAAFGTWYQGLSSLVNEFNALGSWDRDGQFHEKGSAVRTELVAWAYIKRLIALAGYSPPPQLQNQVRMRATSASTHGVEVSNTNCAATPMIDLMETRLPEAFAWQDVASRAGADLSQPLLQPAFLREHLCAQPILHPTDGLELSTILPGGTGTLRLHVGYRIDGGNARFDTPFDVRVTPSGATDNAVVSETTTPVFGRFQHDFTWAANAAEFRLAIHACFITLAQMCVDRTITRGGPSSIPATQTPVGGVPPCVNTIKAEGQSVSGEDVQQVETSKVRILANGTIDFYAKLDAGQIEITTADAFVMRGTGTLDLRIAENDADHRYDAHWTDAEGFKDATITVVVGELTRSRPSALKIGQNLIGLPGRGTIARVTISVKLKAPKAGDYLTVSWTVVPSGTTWVPDAECG